MSVFKRLPPSLLIAVFTLCNLIGNAQQPRLVLPVGHTSKINTIAFSPDEKYMVSAGLEMFVYVWDVPTGKLVWALAGHESPGLLATFSKDGKYIISMGSYLEKENCIVWNFLTGLPIAKFHVNDFSAISQLSNNLILINETDSSKIFDISKKKFVFRSAKTVNHQITLDGKGNFLQIVANKDEYAIEKYNLSTFTLINKVNIKLNHSKKTLTSDIPTSATLTGKRKRVLSNGFVGYDQESAKLEFSVSKTGKYICLSKKGNADLSADTPIDSLFLIDGITGNLIYNTVYNMVTKSWYNKDGSKVFFSQDETLLIWRGSAKRYDAGYVNFDDHASVLKIKDQTIKEFNVQGLNETSLLIDSNLYSYKTAMVTSAEWGGTKNISYVYELNVYTGVRKPVLRIHGQITSFANHGKYLLCTTEDSNNLSGYENIETKKLQTLLINTSSGKIEVTYPNQITPAFDIPKNNIFSVYDHANFDIGIYKPQKKLSPISIAKATLNKQNVIEFIHQDSILYTGNRFLNLKTLDATKNFKGTFIEYRKENDLVKLFHKSDSVTTVYVVSSLKKIKQLNGAPIRPINDSLSYENYKWVYSLTHFKGNTLVSSLVNDINFEAQGKFHFMDDSLNYLITTINPAEATTKNKVGWAYSENSKYVESIPSQTSIWDLRSGQLLKKIDLPLEEYLLDSNEVLRFVLFKSKRKDSAETVLFNLKNNTLKYFKGDFDYISEDERYLYTDPQAITITNRFKKKNDSTFMSYKYDLETDKLIELHQLPEEQLANKVTIEAPKKNVVSVVYGEFTNTDKTYSLKIAGDGKATLSSLTNSFVDQHLIIPRRVNEKQLDHITRVTVTSDFKSAFLIVDSIAYLIDLKINKIKALSTNKLSDISHVDFIANNEVLRIESYNFDDANVSYWNVKNGERILKLENFNSLGRISNDEKTIANHLAGATTLYHLPSGKPYLTYVELDSVNYLSKINNGYYMATPGASKQVYYVNKDLKIVTFEQLDVKYNRPDKVLQEIGSTDTAMINSYKKAYEKRIKKLDIDTTSFKSGYSVPEADFKNRDLIGTEQKKQRLALHVTGKDNTYNLDRFNVWVNESPVFGMRGINIRKRNKKMIDTIIYITLSDGPNQIETSITNINGTESYRMPLNVNYTPEKKAVEKLYFVGIGIDQFKQSQNNLQWSVKDVRDQANALKLKYGNNISIDTLFNHSVTVANVKALKKKLKLSGVNDKVIIAYSGHGMLSNDYDYFLSTYNVNFDKPQQNGLPYDDLEDLLDNIPARKKLMLIDACHSGEVDKEELLKYKNAENVLANNKTSGARGVKVMNTGPKKAGMKTSMELMQQLFVNVGRSTGATVISAAAGTQFALEKSDLKNGVFSYSILEYMQNNPHATVSELKKYVNKRVVELTAGLQVPTTRNETNTVNWQVW